LLEERYLAAHPVVVTSRHATGKRQPVHYEYVLSAGGFLIFVLFLYVYLAFNDVLCVSSLIMNGGSKVAMLDQKE
jgi:hypothetical protein